MTEALRSSGEFVPQSRQVDEATQTTSELDHQHQDQTSKKEKRRNYRSLPKKSSEETNEVTVNNIQNGQVEYSNAMDDCLAVV